MNQDDPFRDEVEFQVIAAGLERSPDRDLESRAPPWSDLARQGEAGVLEANRSFFDVEDMVGDEDGRFSAGFPGVEPVFSTAIGTRAVSASKAAQA